MKYTTMDYKGITYEVVFNLNVMQKIQEEYGSFEAWGNLTDGGEGETDIKALIFGIMHAINEGIDIYNEDHEEEPRKFLTDKQVGRLVSEIGLEQATTKMNESVIEAVQSDEKN